jgi:hypothetical protein
MACRAEARQREGRSGVRGRLIRWAGMRWAILWILLIGLVLLPFILFEQQFNAFAEHITQSGTSR